MSYLVLARKWRPRSFAELVGQEHVRQALVNALDSGRVHHAFLFTGTRGVGKTTIARILARSLNCERGVELESLRRVRSLPGNRRGPLHGPDRGRRGLAHQGRRHAGAPRERPVPAESRPLQGLPDRRSPHVVGPFLQRVAEDARGAATARQVPARDDRPAEAAGDGVVALPAIQPEAAAGRADRGAPVADPRGRGRCLRGAGRAAARAGGGRKPARRALAPRPDAGVRRRPRDGDRRARDARHRGSPAGPRPCRTARGARCARRCSTSIAAIDEFAPDYGQLLDELAALLQKVALRQAVPGSGGGRGAPA